MFNFIYRYGFLVIYFHIHEYVLNSHTVCCGVHSKNAWIPNGFVCLLICVGRGSVFGDSLEYKGESAQF